MAKQSGIHQLKGKVRGMSYYRQKGVTDGLARSINQGLSKRVKEDAAYANTRLNAAEFGSAGSFAGAAIRAISERQRTMLKDFATGDLAKRVKDIIAADTTHPWGNRQLVGDNWQELLRQTISNYAKIEFRYNVGGVWDVSVADTGSGYNWIPNAELPTGWGAPLLAKGATGAYIDMYAYSAEMVELGEGSLKGVSSVAPIASEDVVIGETMTIVEPVELQTPFENADKDNSLLGVLVVVRPYKEINGQKYIMQELCTFQLSNFTEA